VKIERLKWPMAPLAGLLKNGFHLFSRQWRPDTPLQDHEKSSILFR
jgi:hypothetical protein